MSNEGISDQKLEKDTDTRQNGNWRSGIRPHAHAIFEVGVHCFYRLMGETFISDPRTAFSLDTIAWKPSYLALLDYLGDGRAKLDSRCDRI